MLLTKIIDENITLKKFIRKDSIIRGISSDSRRIKPGMIFAAIKGDNYNGVNFVKDVIKKGVDTLLCDKKYFKNINKRLI